MDNKIRKMLKKVSKDAKEQLRILEKNNRTSAELYLFLNNLQKLEEVIIDWNQPIRKSYIIKKKKYELHQFELILLFTPRICNYLKLLNAPQEEIYGLANYIVEEFVKTYHTTESFNKWDFANAYYIILKKKLIAGKMFNNEMLHEIAEKQLESISKEGLNNKWFQSLMMCCKKLKENKEIENIPYFHQTEVLNEMGIEADYYSKLYDEVMEKNQIVIAEQTPIENNEKEQDTTNELPLQKETDTNDKKSDKKEEKYNLQSPKEKENRAKRKVLLEQLKRYINPVTLETNFILEEDEIKNVLKLVSSLYDGASANKIKHTILENNQKQMNIRIAQIRELLIPEDKMNLYNSLYNYCYTYQGQEIQYKFIILNYLNEINNLISEYMEGEDELMIPDYKEHMELVFSELEMYLPYLPQEVIAGPSRT